MIYKLQELPDNNLEEVYQKAMKDLNSFYGRNWNQNMPAVFIVDDRTTIDSLRQEETSRWVKAWNDHRNVFMLNNEHMETESSHKKLSDEEYAASMKHELSHSFFFKVSNGFAKPWWLLEGVSIFTSGQTKLWEKPQTLDSFLGYHEKGGEKLYSESGFAVEALVNTYGKEKLLDLIKSLPQVDTPEKFNIIFEGIYGFYPSYEEFNKIHETHTN